MNLEPYLPPPVEHVLDGSPNPYSYNRMLMMRVKALGSFTTRCCQRALQDEVNMETILAADAEDEGQEGQDVAPSFLVLQPATAKAIQKLFDEWTRYYVVTTAAMREIHDLKLPDGRAYKTTLGGHVFYELTRLHWLLAQPQLLLERENTVRVPHNMWQPAEYDFTFALSHTKADLWVSVNAPPTAGAAAVTTKKPSSGGGGEEDDTEPVHVIAAREWRQRLNTLWTTPIMQYTMTQVRIMAAFLTQNINEVDARTMDEFRRVFRLLWLRCGTLANHGWDASVWSASLDDPEMRVVLPASEGPNSAGANRAWAVYCSFYLGEMVRRFYHYDVLVHRTLQVPAEAISAAAVERMKQWITKSVVGTFAEEAFEEIHQGVVTERDGAYDFPGDGAWFRYANPTSVATLGAIITSLRPHLYDRFFSEEQVDRNVLLASVSRSHLARLFLLHALDSYIKITHARVEFVNGVVIDNGGIEQSAYALKTGMAPLLLQVFGRYWVYWKGCVHVSDDIWVTMTLWWWLLREHCGSKLYGIDLSTFVEEAVPARARAAGPVGATRFEL
jgi:hypothetical protein